MVGCFQNFFVQLSGGDFSRQRQRFGDTSDVGEVVILHYILHILGPAVVDALSFVTQLRADDARELTEQIHIDYWRQLILAVVSELLDIRNESRVVDRRCCLRVRKYRLCSKDDLIKSHFKSFFCIWESQILSACQTPYRDFKTGQTLYGVPWRTIAGSWLFHDDGLVYVSVSRGVLDVGSPDLLLLYRAFRHEHLYWLMWDHGGVQVVRVKVMKSQFKITTKPAAGPVQYTFTDYPVLYTEVSRQRKYVYVVGLVDVTPNATPHKRFLFPGDLFGPGWDLTSFVNETKKIFIHFFCLASDGALTVLREEVVSERLLCWIVFISLHTFSHLTQESNVRVHRLERWERFFRFQDCEFIPSKIMDALQREGTDPVDFIFALYAHKISEEVAWFELLTVESVGPVLDAVFLRTKFQ